MADTTKKSTDLKLVVVTPEATVLDVWAEFVTVPLFDGEKGIGCFHAPMIGRLGFGALRYRWNNEIAIYYVDGGFVQVQDNTISVLTNRALPVDEIDIDAAELQLSESLTRKTSTEDELATRDRLILQARAQKRLSKS